MTLGDPFMKFSPQKPILFKPGQRVCVDYGLGQAFKGTIKEHHGYRPLNGDNEWVVVLDKADGYQVAGDSEMLLLAESPSPDLAALVREFFEYLDRTEISDEGRKFHPVTLSCCRCMWIEPMGKIISEMRRLANETTKSL